VTTAPWQHGLDEAANALPDHVWGNVNDCRRCLFCEALQGKPGPCRGQTTVAWVPCWKCEYQKRTKCGGGCIDGFVPRVVPRG